MNKYARPRLSLALLPAIVVSFFVSLPMLAAVPNHVVISEIQIGGITAADEFVELYNPTNSSVNLAGWRLSKRTASGNQTNLLTAFPDVNLPAGGYFLITHPTGYAGTIAADAKYSTSESMAANNTVVLFSDAGATIVDLVGMGTASSFETAATATPPNGQSIERLKDGNGIIDTDNNASDFILVTAPTPMNLASQPPAQSTPPADQSPAPTPPNDTTSTPAETLTAPLSPSGGSLPLAVPHDILINEFVSDPSDEDEEWIELINRTGRTIDLTSWIIEDGAEHETILSGSIAGVMPNNFFVVTKPKGNLNNAGDRIILKTQNGQIIDSVSYGNWADGNIADNAPAANDPASTARTVDGLSTGNAFTDFMITLTPTRGAPNIMTTAASTTPTGPATLRLSELFPNPVGSDAAEFIEVTNIGAGEVSIIGWRISDMSGADYTVQENDFSNPLVSPGAYLNLPRTLTGIALNNSGGETVRLFPPGANSPVHEISYTGSAPEGASWASTVDQWKWTTATTAGTANVISLANRKPVVSVNLPKQGLVNDKLLFSAEDSTDPDGDALTFQWNFGDGQTSAGETAAHAYAKAGRYRVKLTIDDSHGAADTAEGTVTIEPRAEPQVLGISTTVYAAGTSEIILNEIFPAPPKGEEEWIEFYNQGNETASLAGWSLKDASGRTYTISSDTMILPQSYLLLKKFQTRLALNNTGDDVILFNAAGETVDDTSYPAAKISASWMRDENDEWDWTNRPTPLAANILSAIEDSSDKAASSAFSGQLPRGQLTISGTVTSAPGMIGERVLYLTGLNMAGLPSNLRVDLPTDKINVAIKLNDMIAVTGTVRQVQGEPRMSVKNIAALTVTGASRETIKPTPLELTDVETDLGRLVVASGTVSKKTSGGFVLELPGGETIRAVMPASSKKFPYPLDTEVTVTGLLSRTSAGTRILLRTMEDLVVNSQPLANETAPTNTPVPILNSYLVVTILGLVTFMAALFYRYWQKRKRLAAVTVEGLDEEEMV